MFDRATRMKLRFNTTKGPLSVEDLWTLPLTGQVSLDNIAMALAKQLREAAVATSFVTPAEKDDGVTQLSFDIVKHIIDVRVKERNEAKLTSELAEKKQKLLEIVSRKQDAELEGKSVEDLMKMINDL